MICKRKGIAYLVLFVVLFCAVFCGLVLSSESAHAVDKNVECGNIQIQNAQNASITPISNNAQNQNANNHLENNNYSQSANNLFAGNNQYKSAKAVESANTASESTDIFVRIDAYLADAVMMAHFPAMSVTIVDKDSVLMSKTYGECESTDVPFLLGSVSKSFTALCIMQLSEQGKIDINAPLSTYLKDVKDADRITILQLLNHTSGLGEYQNLTNCKITDKQGVHLYSNVNYSLLGEVIESVSGETYEEYVTRHIFQPLSMTQSATNLEQSKANGLIQGYENWFGVNTKTAPKYPKDDNAWITMSAGYLSASTADLGRYLQMYLRGGEGIISAQSIHDMFYKNVYVENTIPYSYGMGWTLMGAPLLQPTLRHSGWVETGMATIYIFPESGIGVAMAINANDYFVGKDMMDRIDWGVALMLTGDAPNEIGENEYATKHFLISLAYIVVLIISILPLCLLSVYKKRLSKGKMWKRIAVLLALHLLLPVIILLVPTFVSTPLWVVMAFVPDLFTCIVASSCLLFIGGVVKTAMLIANRKAGMTV